MYNYCTSTSAAKNSSASTINTLNINPHTQQVKSKKDLVSVVEGAQIYGVELYQKLQRFLETYLERLLKV